MRSALASLRLLAVVVVSTWLLGSTPARAGLMGYWNFDGDVADSSGSGNNASVYGTESYSTDTPSQVSGTDSFNFNGSTAVHLPFMDFYGQASTTGATLSMWVKVVPQSDDRIFGEAVSSTATVNAGKMRNIRETANRSRSPSRTRLCVTRKPLRTKKTSTA